MYTVVVADDEEELRQALICKVNWAEAGFQVVGEARNGAEALELVEDLQPDLLITDVRMPFMTGIELARAVREIRPTMQIAFLSGFDDFSYAQQAIQYNIISYMLKPITSKKMTEELKKIRIKIDQKFEEFSRLTQKQEESKITEFLMPLLLDSFQGELSQERDEILLDEAVRCGFLKSKSHMPLYVVMVIKLWNENGENCTTQGSVTAIGSILKKYLKYSSFYTDGRVIFLLMGSKFEMDKYLHILVEDIVQSVKRITGLNTSIGVSREEQRLMNCHEAYIEAMNAISYCKRYESRVNFISDIERSDTFDHEVIQNAVNEIENLLRGGTQQELVEYLRNMLEWIKREELAPIVSQMMMVQLVAAVYRVVDTVADKGELQELHSTSLMPRQIFHEEPVEFWGKYINFCLEARKLVSEQRSKSGSVICDQALAIIQEKYSDPNLSLVSISTEIAVTPNYLSALIKKSTGNTFIGLLTAKRIETAREMLLGTSMKIREIAERCGYNDQHYFSYCFKKYTGLSPNACRRKNE